MSISVPVPGRARQSGRLIQAFPVASASRMFAFSTDNAVPKVFPAVLSETMANDRKLLWEAKAFISAWPPVTTPDRWSGFSWLRRAHAGSG